MRMGISGPIGRLADRISPLYGAVRDYDSKRNLRPDLIAAATLWALLVPQGLAGGELAGLSPVTGLYTALGAGIVYVLFGGSRFVNVGPESATAIIVAVTIAPIAAGDTGDYVALSAALAIMVGIFLLIGALLRAGWIARLLSEPVLTGYLAGVGFVIIASQAGRALGIETTSDESFIQHVIELTHALDQVSWIAIAMAVGTGALAIGLNAIRWPGALIALAAATAATYFTDLDQRLDIVGEIDRGMPLPGIPGVDLGQVADLAGPALALALLVFAGSVMTGRAVGDGLRDRVEPSREFMALGGANIATGLLGGFAAKSSDSRSVAMRDADQRTRLAPLVATALLALTLILLTPLFHELPDAALGAVIIITAVRLIRFDKLATLWKMRAAESLMAIFTLAGVLVLGLMPGILMGVLASLAEAMRRAMFPNTAVLGKLKGTDGAWRNVNRHNHSSTVPGLIVYRFDAPLFFANADLLRDEVNALVDRHEANDDPVQEVIIDAEAIYDIDSTGLATLRELLRDLDERNIRLVMARLRTRVQVVLRDAGVEDLIGEGNFYLRVNTAVEAFRDRN